MNPLARLTFIGLWTYVDDDGRAVDDLRLIRAAVWALDDRTLEQVDTDLRQLGSAGLVQRYEVDGKRYLAITNWAEHQKVSHPRATRYPPPPDVIPNGSGKHPEDSGGSPPRVAGAEQGAGSREQGAGREDANASLSGSGEPNADPAAKPVPKGGGSTDVVHLFEYWRDRCDHPGATLTKDRRAKIKERLKVFTTKQLEAAIEGARASPFHQGQNDRHTRYDWLETIFKTDSSAEKLMLANQNGTHGKSIIRESI